MESAVRRVISMRRKGPGIFRHEDTAETMRMIRAQYDARNRSQGIPNACTSQPQGVASQRVAVSNRER